MAALGLGVDARSVLRAGGKVEPIFVETIAEMPDAIRQVARDGDVVLTMGAGSISGVPHQLISQPGAQPGSQPSAQPAAQAISQKVTS